MSLPAVAKPIMLFVVKQVWPWFLKNVWPIIAAHAMKLIEAGLKGLGQKLQEFLDHRTKDQQQRARERADAAEAAGMRASSSVEREKQEAIAKVWREVAEQLRAENEVLKAQVTDLIAVTEQSILAEVRNSEPTLTEVNGNPTLALGDTKTRLPALPSHEKK